MKCECERCRRDLFPRERGQCHGFGRYVLPCKRRVRWLGVKARDRYCHNHTAQKPA